MKVRGKARMSKLGREFLTSHPTVAWSLIQEAKATLEHHKAPKVYINGEFYYLVIAKRPREEENT